MRRRDKKDIWQGLFDFCLVEKNRPHSINKITTEESVAKKIMNRIVPALISKKYKHALSHQNIHATFVVINSDNTGAQDLRFYSKKQIAALPKPILIQRFLEDYKIL